MDNLQKHGLCEQMLSHFSSKVTFAHFYDAQETMEMRRIYSGADRMQGKRFRTKSNTKF